jgi:hypothetical protein
VSPSEDEDRWASRLEDFVAVGFVVFFVLGLGAWEWHWPGRYVLIVLCDLFLAGTLVGVASAGSREMDASPEEWWRSGKERVLEPIRLRSHGQVLGRLRLLVDVPVAIGGLALFWAAARTVSLWRRVRPR